MTLWAFLGMESACANSEAVENPEKNVPIAVLGGTLGAAVIYIVSTKCYRRCCAKIWIWQTLPRHLALAFTQMFTPGVGKNHYGANDYVLLWIFTWLAVHHRTSI